VAETKAALQNQQRLVSELQQEAVIAAEANTQLVEMEQQVCMRVRAGVCARVGVLLCRACTSA
jgi:hypothetical protein